ncbi:MAG: hypothetical protein E5V59_08775 [Mesorhizobium sp.]|nr:MAG: hypothetical protein E5V59_08775 [Mesorhizobium sp.]
MMKIWNLEKSIELEFFVKSTKYLFRLEALKLSGEENKYRVRMFEYDLFRITPSFDEHIEGGADHLIPVSNLLIDGQEYHAESADEALQIAIKRLHVQGFV